ncbi:hypothetical protein LUZ61_012236 [Rhynchospora tenuis]|uniref:Protein FAR1-RELATED SEQUENCE n=1 Tax=Rhynchospora tenuis TaxID=198213 RepID=A0AAD6A2N2_9POAL|nr:hypothetical protein LUZ61_012236 [Rhynchospora tenuis]
MEPAKRELWDMVWSATCWLLYGNCVTRFNVMIWQEQPEILTWTLDHQFSQECEAKSNMDMESSGVWSAPYLGMEFATLDEAWLYWRNYGGSVGFGVRKRSGKKGKDGVYTSYTYFCQSEGLRKKDKRDHLTKIPRAVTRTNCKVFFKVKLYRDCQKYKVVSYEGNHNHPLQKPEACYLISSQREVSEVARIDIHLADSSGIRPRETLELLSKQAGGVRSIGYTIDDLNNCLRDKRKEAMQYGAAVAITKYFAKRVSENPSFQHFEDITENQEIANILWMDGRMIAAYARFGEVVIFDTTFGTNKEKWGFGTFVGFNHFREIVIFGATLMCDQNTNSFEWGIDMYKEFSECMFNYEDEDDFEKAIKEFATKLEDEEDIRWIKFIYDCKEKWAYCFMKNAYTLGIRSTQANESFNSTLKRYLNLKNAPVRVDKLVVLSCKMFERVEILCCHALKVLDREDIKIIPPKYILKSWTQDAKDVSVVDRQGRVVIEDAMLDVRNRHAQMMRELASTCDKVCHDEGKSQFVLNALRSIREKVDEIDVNPSSRTNNCGEDKENRQSENSLRLKKKDGDAFKTKKSLE